MGIRQSSDQGYITVEVSDTGCEVSSEQTMKRMFDKFYQDTSHTAEEMELGLSLISVYCR